MGQKMDPHGLRVGVIKDWDSKWYANKKDFANYLVEDHKIREYVKKKLYVSGISKIEIERTAKFVKVNVFTAKPGLVIVKGGNLAESLKNELSLGKSIRERLFLRKRMQQKLRKDITNKSPSKIENNFTISKELYQKFIELCYRLDSQNPFEI